MCLTCHWFVTWNAGCLPTDAPGRPTISICQWALLHTRSRLHEEQAIRDGSWRKASIGRQDMHRNRMLKSPAINNQCRRQTQMWRKKQIWGVSHLPRKWQHRWVMFRSDRARDYRETTSTAKDQRNPINTSNSQLQQPSHKQAQLQKANYNQKKSQTGLWNNTTDIKATVQVLNWPNSLINQALFLIKSMYLPNDCFLQWETY